MSKATIIAYDSQKKQISYTIAANFVMQQGIYLLIAG